MYKFLNKESNYELMSELLGENETEILRAEAKNIGKAQMKKELAQKRYRHIANKLIAYKTIGILLPLL